MSGGSEGRPVGDRRAEEAFAALAAGGDAKPPAPDAGGGAGPWKVAAFLFFALALALPLAAGVRESRRDAAEADLRDQAQASLFRVRSLAGERRPAVAVRALGETTAALADVPGLHETVEGLARAVEDEREQRAEEVRQVRSILAEDGRRAATWKVALDAILAGERGAPAGLLGDDAVSVALRALFDRLAMFDAAVSTADPGERLARLAELAEVWPYPPVAQVRREIVSALEDEATARAALRAARDSVRAGDAEAAWRAIAKAGEGSRLVELAEIVRGIQRLTRLGQAAALEGTDAATAAALYRAAALDAGVPSGEIAEKIRGLEEAARQAALVAGLRTLAARARDAGMPAFAAMCHEALAGLTGDEAERAKAREAEALVAALRAGDCLRQGRLEAARYFAEEVSRLGAPDADRLLREIEAEATARAGRERAEQAREALAAGAPEFALRLSRGSDVPEGFRQRAEAMAREQGVLRARAALFAGDAEGALAALGEGRDAGELRAHAEFLRGRPDEGMAWLGEPGEEARMVLYRAAAALLVTDPAAAGRLAVRAGAAGGEPAELVGALARALDAADEGSEGSPLWTALRDEALKRAPLPAAANPQREPEQEPAGETE